MLIHLYVAFWRPDIRDQLADKGSPIAAICDFVGNAQSVRTDTRDVTCPACRETFLQALPTGDGSKLTWEQYLRSPAATPRVTLAQRAAEADKADAAWGTTPAPAVDVLATVKAPPDQWATKPGPQADMWATAPQAPVQPGGPATGWKTN